jgi:hypothetical protein
MHVVLNKFVCLPTCLQYTHLFGVLHEHVGNSRTPFLLKEMLVAMWFRIRDAAVRAVVLWSTLHGTRRQLSAVVTVLVLDATLIQPEVLGLHVPFVPHNLTEETKCGPPLSKTQSSVTSGVMSLPPSEMSDDEIDWWAWIACAHTILDALVFLPWPELCRCLLRSIQQIFLRLQM